MQWLAFMMAVMVLGMPQVHSCHGSADLGMLWNGEVSEVRVCLPTMLKDKVEVSVMGEQLDPSHWRKLPAVHCQATQSVLSFTCGLDGRMGRVKHEIFRQPCRIQSTACWEVLEGRKLKVGELKLPVVMNATRSHMEGVEDCSENCGPRAGES